MLTFQQLLDLADNCYRQAHAAVDPLESCELTLEGDEYLRRAKEVRQAKPNSPALEQAGRAEPVSS